MGFTPTYVVLTIIMFVNGFGAGGFQTLNGAMVSHSTAPEYFGRVVSLTFLAFAASSIVALPMGFVADAYGERPTLIAAGVIVCAITASLMALERTIKDGPAVSVGPADIAAG